jgi:predicted DNA-binding transcriptional regulator AlpA
MALIKYKYGIAKALHKVAETPKEKRLFIKAIVKETGVSQTTIYNYFDLKEEDSIDIPSRVLFTIGIRLGYKKEDIWKLINYPLPEKSLEAEIHDPSGLASKFNIG